MRKELAEKVHQLLQDPAYLVSEALLDKIGGATQLGGQLPATVDCRKEETVRQVQRVLTQVEIRLDHLARTQYRAKRILQTCALAERQLVHALQDEGLLKEKVTKAERETALYTNAPDLVEIQDCWQLVETLCGEAQKRLAGLKATVKIQKDLDDNLRWAQRG